MSQVKTKKPVISLDKLRVPIYLKTSNFDPHVRIKKTSYSALHDPYLRDYYHHRETSVILKKTKESTADDKVKSTVGENKMHQRYLRQQRLFTDRDVRDIERAKMKHFLVQRQEGQEMTLTELREQMLDEYVENLRLAMEAERIRLKGAGLKDDTLELELLRCKEEKRKQLRRIQSDVQHEWNLEKQRREEKERRERQKCAAEKRWAAVQRQRLLEQVECSDKSALDEINKERNPPCRSNITTKNPDARPAVEQRPMNPQIKAPVARRCWR
ncbi:hypothetical protein GJAV_G00264770 [Gymnothorax javanicus]|nr:hypothetical protein GJAV_G00264770 [Gymnothorax javanicus]